MQAPYFAQNKISSMEKRQLESVILYAKQSYDLSTSNQKTLMSPSKYGYYKVLLYKGYLYVIDGCGSCTVIRTQKPNSSEMSLKHQKVISPRQRMPDYTFKNATILNNEAYLFGKCEMNPIPSSLIIKVNLSTGVYQQFEGIGTTPDFKEHCLIQSINNMYILQFGGYSQKDNIISNDAQLLVFKEWKKLKINREISPRYKFSYATCGNKVYLHGGQSIDNGSVKYHSELYLLTISDVNFELTFTRVQSFSSAAPIERSGHCMTSIKDRYLVLFGGQTSPQNDEDKNAPKSLRDMWLFDTFQKTWSLLDLPLPIQKILNFQFQCIKNYKNQLYLLGFVDAEEKRKSKIIRFSFSEPWEVLNKQNITQPDSDTEEHLQGKGFELTTSMVHCASYSLRFPFQAIQKIVEYVQDREASFIRIYSELTSNTIDKYIYISLDFDTKASVGRQNSQLEFNQLLYCSLRLGKTILYVQNYNDSTDRRVTLISADGKYSPLVEKIQLKYSYTENKITGFISKKLQSRNKSLILKIMQSLVENPIQLIRSVSNSKIMIFSPNIIPTPKTYYYELVFDSAYDISVFKNNKKVEMLQKLKYDVSASMELSLHNFLKYAKCETDYHNGISENGNTKANQPLKIYLNSYAEPISRSVHYSQYLEEYYKKGKLIKLQIPKNTVQFTQFFELYACFDDFYLPENNGVLIYKQGKLVNRYDCEFGKVLAQKFYQKKIHKDNRNIFKVVGEIHVSDQLKLINFNTELQKTQKYLSFRLSVEKAIQAALKKMAPQLKMHEQRPKEVVISDVENKNSVNDTIVPVPEIRKNIGFEMTLERKQEMQNYNVYIDQDSVDSEMYNSISKKVKNDKNSQS